MRTRTVGWTVALAAAVTGMVVGAAPAGASGRDGQLRVDHVVADTYVGPLQFDVSRRGTFVADGFTSTLNEVGVDAPLATGGDPSTGGDVGGVTVNPYNGDVVYTTSTGDHSQTFLVVRRNGRQILKADLAAYEAAHNPDQHVTYGAYRPSDCARDALTAAGMPVTYTGLVDSHPYSVTTLRDGSYAVAEAGGNDVVRVTPRGAISTLAVLPPRWWTIPAAFAQEKHLPDCVVGTRYRVEGVATDVETGPGGRLYVSSLPGSDARDLGVVYRLDRHGRLDVVGSGLDEALNIAVTPSGRVYVVELGKGRISVLDHGRPRSVLELPGVVGVEASGGRLFASVAPALIGQQAPGAVLALARA